MSMIVQQLLWYAYALRVNDLQLLVIINQVVQTWKYAEVQNYDIELSVV